MSSSALKIIALSAMLIDHIAWKMDLSFAFFLILHGVGRLAMPIFCFQVAQGFMYTKSRKKYALRLFIFAVISQIPFSIYMKGVIFYPYFNVIFTLLFGFLTLWLITSEKNIVIKIALITLFLILSMYCDWAITGVLWILAFGLAKNKNHQQGLFLAVSILTVNFNQLIQVFVFFSLVLLYFYNGKKSSENIPKLLGNKYIFYVFYPLHLLIIGMTTL